MELKIGIKSRNALTKLKYPKETENSVGKDG